MDGNNAEERARRGRILFILAMLLLSLALLSDPAKPHKDTQTDDKDSEDLVSVVVHRLFWGCCCCVSSPQDMRCCRIHLKKGIKRRLRSSPRTFSPVICPTTFEVSVSVAV
jgi:hypothetical protein